MRSLVQIFLLCFHFISSTELAPRFRVYDANNVDDREAQIDFQVPRFLRQYGSNPLNFNDPDCNRTTLELINSKGYFGEQHHVVTNDGYILGLQRIPAPRGQRKDPKCKRTVVLLQHGLESSSFAWVANLANQSLGFLLADTGFDVWLANSRGNVYSTMHKYLSIRDPKFWQFSWDQMARYDLPAAVDYILEETGQRQLYYVGHSQGTVIGFAKFSTDQEFAKKIKTFFALAPVARLAHTDTGLTKLKSQVENVVAFYQKFGIQQFLPHHGFLHDFRLYVCSDKIKNKDLCQNLMFAWSGSDGDNLNQMLNSGEFVMYDYATNSSNYQNYIHYGQKSPPIYDVSKLNVPTVLFHSQIDKLADPQDVAWLISQINKTVVGNYHYTNYNHQDFTFGMNAVNDIYKHIIKYIYKQEMASFFHY